VQATRSGNEQAVSRRGWGRKLRLASAAGVRPASQAGDSAGAADPADAAGASPRTGRAVETRRATARKTRTAFFMSDSFPIYTPPRQRGAKVHRHS
jgi:hypothetical protein